MLTANQIRELFLDYFSRHQHTRIKSASLVPQNDPTLYFTNAGMVPFKNIFTGLETREFKRAATSQKCMRVSGKHNDLENVGRTKRHHTFFEMLGNFSFGDYFKKEAIAFAWDFLTNVVKINPDKLWVTVFENDDEAFDLWHTEQHVPKECIVRLGEADNFWSMGETGPCGPCSEIHFAFDTCTPLDKTNRKEWFVHNSDAGNIMEIWNLVFMQFEQHADGTRTPLPKPSIDTGMGLERVSCVLQNVTSNYDTDIFAALLKKIQQITQKTYGKDKEDDFSMRVLADHIRSTVFLIADGVLPSNEGRGYVLRRIMRRAIRHGKRLGQTQPFFYKIAPDLVHVMGDAYPELKTEQHTVAKVIHAEEERFFETLDKGLKILNEAIPSAQNKTLSGAVAFKLYDTFGFPLDLTQMIAEENGLSVDTQGFDAEMQQQKERARAHWKGTDQEKTADLYLNLSQTHKTEFLGYDALTCATHVAALIQNGRLVDSVTGGQAELIVNQTPFYAEGGGQVGDQGTIEAKDFSARVTDTQKPVEGLFVHHIEVLSGTLCINDAVQLSVHRHMRLATMRNHTATHLLHAALRQILGSHVRQAGSLVNAELLRFDFTHFEGISPATLQQIENAVNHAILENLCVSKSEMTFDDAIKAKALAFFGDKYGDTVRVVKMGEFSTELCGGTHLQQTAEVGCFKIISETSVAAGVRRIEAVTGTETLTLLQTQTQLLHALAQQLKATPLEFSSRIEKMSGTIKTLEKEIEKLKSQLLRGQAQDYLKNIFTTKTTKAAYYQAQISDAKELQSIAQIILEKLGSGIAVVGAEVNGKANLMVLVSKDVASLHPAQNILAPLAELIGGKGGGKAERAQAGGDQLQGLAQVPQKLREILQN